MPVQERRLARRAAQDPSWARAVSIRALIYRIFLERRTASVPPCFQDDGLMRGHRGVDVHCMRGGDVPQLDTVDRCVASARCRAMFHVSCKYIDRSFIHGCVEDRAGDPRNAGISMRSAV